MTEIDLIIYTTGAAVLTGWIAILAYAALKGWNGWLDFKRSELELVARDHHAPRDGVLTAGTRIDVADLKERIRKLEAIASGVDL